MEATEAHETPVPVDDETQDPAEDMQCDDNNNEPAEGCDKK